MQRIATATKAVDLHGVGKHGFKDGNIGLGIVATDFNAEWPNGVQEEIVRVIEAAGLAPSGADLGQLLQALRAAGVFTTPAQFDNTTKAATTAFVKTLGLEARGISVPTVTSTIGVSAIGGTVAVNSASATTQTLPAANAVASGARLEFLNINTAAATIARAGADTLKVNNGTAMSIALGAGDTLTLESDGVSTWYAVGGSAQLGYAAVFSASRAAPGYQKLPGGLIIQWGPAATNNSAITFPIAFPTALLAGPIGSEVNAVAATSGIIFMAGSPTTTGFQAFIRDDASNPASSVTIRWVAIGH